MIRPHLLVKPLVTCFFGVECTYLPHSLLALPPLSIYGSDFDYPDILRVLKDRVAAIPEGYCASE
jgi:hypothetical protein